MRKKLKQVMAFVLIFLFMATLLPEWSGGKAYAASGNIINTVAGTGNGRFSGDEGQATLAELANPSGVAVDSSGNLYIADSWNNVIRKVDTTGKISTVAGKFIFPGAYSGDGGQATLAELNYPTGIALDGSGNMYIVDYSNNVIRKVDKTTGKISTVAGTGTAGYSGDGGQATAAKLFKPLKIALDSSGNLYIADSGNNVVRKVNSSGVISTFAGTGTVGYSGDGGQATAAKLNFPSGVTVGSSGSLYIADTYNNVIRKVDSSGKISTFAGTGSTGASGDWGLATAAQLNQPMGIALDSSGNLYITDNSNRVIRKVDTSGIISKVAGGGFSSALGDGGPATAAYLNLPNDIAVGSSGNLYIADTSNYRIRMVSPANSISFNLNGGAGTMPASIAVVEGQASTALPGGTGITAPPGKVFGGWNTQADGNGTNYAAGAAISNVTSDILLYVKWNTVTYTISFNLNDGTGTVPTSMTVNYGQASAVLPDGTGITAPSEKVFGGWNTQVDGSGTSYAAGATISNIVSNIPLYAQWKVTYTISFDSKRGSNIVDLVNVASGTTINAPTAPTRTDFTFQGWYKEAALTNVWNFATDKVTGDTTLYAKWTASSSAWLWIYFDANGGEFSFGSTDYQVLKYGTKLDSEPAVFKDGYTFIGWYTDEAFSRIWRFDSDTVTEELTMYAKWVKDGESDAPFVMSYSPADNSRIVKPDTKLTMTFNRNVIAIKGGVIKLQSPVHTDCYEGGCSDFGGDAVVLIDAGDTSKVTVTGPKVVIDLGNIDANEYYVNIAPGSFRDVAGNDYLGLYGSVHYTRFPNSPDMKDIESDWDFIIDENQVFFDSKGGSPVPTVRNIVTGAKITEPTPPTRAGYTFGGWYKDMQYANAWDFATDTVSGRFTLYAKWTAVGPTMYTVSFNTQGGSAVQAITNVVTGTSITAPTVPILTGYAFGGWYKEALLTNAWNFASDKVTGDITLYAKWTAAGSTMYTVSFNSQGGSAVQAITNVVTGTSITAPTAPILTGYAFGGWYKEALLTNAWNFSNDKVTGDITLYAKWTAAGSTMCTVSFNSQGGSAVPAIMNIASGSSIIAPIAPTRIGYTFAGWYKEAVLTNAWSFANDKVTGNIKLYAKWSSAPAPGFDPKPVPEPGTDPGTTDIAGATPGAGNHLRVKVSSSLITTPNTGDEAPSGAGIINPYTAGSDIPGTDPKVNRYIGLYEVDVAGKVVKFTLIILNPEDIKSEVLVPTPAPVPGFNPMPEPEPGTDPGTTDIPGAASGAGNHLRVKVSSSLIATPNVGEAAPTGSGIINPYTAGSDIPGTDPKVNRYIGLYEVDGAGKVVKFTLIILNPEDIKPEVSAPTPAPGFNPMPEPEPGTDPGTTKLPGVTPGAGNHLRVKVSSSLIATPNVGDAAPTGSGIINPYTAGSDIPGTDPKVYRYIGLYEVDVAGKVVKFTLIILNPEDIKPEAPAPIPAPGFDPKPVPEPGTNPETTKLPGVTPGAGNHLRVKVSSSLIAVPNVDDAAPSGVGIINPYTAGSDIPGTDPKVNRYIGLYEVDGAGKVVKFTLIILNPEDIKPEAPAPTPAPGFDPKPAPEPGTNPGTTGIPGATPGVGNHLRVKVSSSLIATPNVGDAAPSGAGIINPYTAGSDIPGTDSKVNRYIGLYEVDGTGKVVKFTLIILNPEDIKPEAPVPIPAPGFDPKPAPEPGTDPGTTRIPGATPGVGNHLRVKVSSSLIATPNVGDAAPSGAGIINPYTAGSNIIGTDSKVNRYIGLYEVDGAGKVVKFTLIILNPDDIKPELPAATPVPGFDPKPVPKPGSSLDTTYIPDITPEADNYLVVKVSSYLIETPNVGDMAPIFETIVPYTGGNIPGVDAIINRYIGLYEVNGAGKVVKFTLIILNPQDINTQLPAPMPGFDPKPVPRPGTDPETTGIPDVTTELFSNHLVVKVSNTLIATPNVGDVAPTFGNIINFYMPGSIIWGADPKVNRYVGLYEVDYFDKVVKFTLIILYPEDFSPGIPAPIPVPGFDPKPAPKPGTDPETTKLPGVTPGAGNHLRVKVSSSLIATPNVGDAAPTDSGIINPYTAGSDIPGTDAKVNRYMGVYEVDGAGKVVKFRLIVLNPEDFSPGVPATIPAPGFDPKPKPEPGTDSDTTKLPGVTSGAGNHLVVKVSSSLIATPNVGDAAPTGSGIINPYTAGNDIPGTDSKVNRYIGIYEVDGMGKVVKFRLIVLNPEDVKATPSVDPTPAPGFDPKPKPEPGTDPDTTKLPGVTSGAGNHLVVKVSSSLIATPNTGDAAPTGSGIINPYTAGTDIPGTDAKVNRYMGVYEVDGAGKVVRFRLIVLNPEDFSPGVPATIPAPGFDPKPKPEPGTDPETTKLPGVTSGAGNHLVVKVSSSLIATPNVGDAAPTGSGIINPYTAGNDIPGTDSKVNRYIGIYEVDGMGKVVKFRLIVLNPEDVKATPSVDPTPAPGFDPKPKPEPGTDPETTKLPGVTHGAGNHLVVKVSSSLIATPNAGDAAPTGSGIINPYSAGNDIPGTDPKVNRYIGIYEVDVAGKVVKFRLIVLNPEDFSPGVPAPTPVPGFDPKPKPEPGTDPDTTKLPGVTSGAGNHLVVKVSSSLIATPNVGDMAPTGSGIINPYTAGTNIPGTDSKVNRYIGIYEVDVAGKVVKFRLIVLNPEDVKATPSVDPLPAPVFTPSPTPEPGTNPGTTKLPGVTPGAGNHLVVKVSSSIIETPHAGDAAPTGSGIINPYTGGNIPGVDTKVNRYIGLYEVDGAGKVVKFSLIELASSDVKPGLDDLNNDIDKLGIMYQEGDDAEHVTKTLYLATKGQSGRTTVTWTSNNPDLIKLNGRVIRPGVDELNAFVTLTATITDLATGTQTTKSFTVQVIRISDEDAVREAAKDLTADKAFTFAEGDMWESVTSEFMLLGQGLHGTVITWTSTDLGTIGISLQDGNAYGSVNRPQSSDKHVLLTAVITKGNATITKTFLMIVTNKTVGKDTNQTRQPTARQAEASVNPDGSASSDQFTILRTTLNNGSKIDTVIIDPAKVESLTNSINPAEADDSKRTVVLQVKHSLVDKADEIAIEIPAQAVAAMADRNALLEIRTDEGIIRISAAALKDAAEKGTDLYFRIVPIKDGEEQNEVKQAVTSDNKVLQIAGGRPIHILSFPRKIETNFSGFTTKVVIPLTGISIPGQNKQEFLNSLHVFVEHTDGTTELLTGVIQYDHGQPVGMEIEINKFSRFQIVNFIASVDNSGSNGSSNGNTPKTADFVPSPSLKPGSSYGTTRAVVDTIGTGNHLVIKISSGMIPSANFGDAAPAGAGVIDPYAAGSDIKGIDSEVNKYIAVYEVDSSNRIVKFKLLIVTKTDIKFGNGLIDLYINKVKQQDTAKLELKGTANAETATVIVDNEAIIKKLQSEKAESILTIPQVFAAKTVEIEMEGHLLKLMYEKSDIIRFETEVATYILPVSAINMKGLMDSLGNPSDLSKVKFRLSISLADAAASAKIAKEVKNGKAEMLITPVDFTITCSFDGKAVDVERYGRYVERLIRLSNDINPKNVTTGVYISENGKMQHVPTAVENIDGVYYVKINSLYNGTYTLVQHPLEFKDTESHWAKNEINDLASRLVIFGTGEKTYTPDRNITRAEFATIIVRALGLKHGGSEKNLFIDVKDTDWYAEYIKTAYEFGIVEGYSNGKFNPMDRITREQAMVMIARAMKITGLSMEFKAGEAKELLAVFKDAEQSSAWALESAAASVKAGIFSGRSKTELAPKENITRSEVAVIVTRLLQKSKLINQ